jgi:hypothetical protein
MYRPRPKLAAPARVPAGAVVTAAEFADLPFGGHAGELLSGGQAAPAPPPPQPLVIEPPPWAAEETGPLVPLASPATGQRAAEVQQRLEPARDPYPARPAREKPARWPA